MAVKYAKNDVAEAKRLGQHLATVAVAGLVFEGTVDDDEQRELVEFYLNFTKRRNERLKAGAAKGEGT